MPEISIVVCNYNTEKYLSRCLESLLKQTFKDIEIIAVDDGSADNSVALMKDYAAKDNRLKVIEQQNSGPGVACNTGIENATGKYLMFCDSDDYYAPHMCQIMYDTIKQRKTDVVCCHSIFEFEENLDSKDKEKRHTDRYFNPDKSGTYLLNNNTILHTNVLRWNKIFRRDIIEQYHLRHPEVFANEDVAFWILYSVTAKNIFYIKDELYHYFVRADSFMGSYMNRKIRNREDYINVIYYLVDFLLKNNLKEHYPLIIDLTRISLQQVFPFYTLNELNELCCSANAYIFDKLKIKPDLAVTFDNEQLVVLKKKSITYCLLGWLKYFLFSCFTKFMSADTHQKMLKKLKKNKVYWRLILKK